MRDGLESFEAFMKNREHAAQAYVEGDALPLSVMATLASPATFFGPPGDYLSGPQPVLLRYKQDAANLSSGKTYFDVLHRGASNGFAYWVGIQHATVLPGGAGEPVSLHLRVTELFRKEGDAWKLIHRHADICKSCS